MHKKITLISCILFFVLSITVSATIDIEPTFLNFENVLKDTEYSKKVIITSDIESDILVSASVSSELAQVVSIEPLKRIVDKTSPLILDVSVVSDSEKHGQIVFCFKNEESSLIATEGEKCVGMELNIIPNDEIVSDFTVIDVKIHDTEQNEYIDVELNIDNKGNADLRPMLVVDGISKEFDSKALNIETIHIPFENKNLVGEYEVPVKVLLNEKQICSEDLNFNVKKRLLEHMNFNIVPIKNVMVNETMSIFSVITNPGEIGLEVEADIEIIKDGKVLQDYEVQDFVGVNEIKQELIKFMPKEKGEYIVKGMVYYSNSYTDVVEQKFTVVDSADAVGLSAGYIGFLALFLVVYVYLQKKFKYQKIKRKK